MRMSVDVDLKRFGRHNAGGKLAGSGHMCLRRVLLIWTYGDGFDTWLCPVSSGSTNGSVLEMVYLKFGDDDIIPVDIDKIRSTLMTAREVHQSSNTVPIEND